MSVGGVVTEVIVQDERVYIDTDDKGDKCAIFVERDKNSETVSVGDKCWWQGSHAYWTPMPYSGREDVTLIRRGFSGVSRPNLNH